MTEQIGTNLATRVMIGGGLLLFLVGGLLTYPYINSRLAPIPPTPTPSSPSPTMTPTTITIAQDAPSPTVPPTPTPSPSPPLPVSPSSPPPPSPTTPLPTPAYPTRITIPALRVDAPILPVSTQLIDVGGGEHAAWQVPDEYAAGWHDTSAPLGAPGNTVLNGHNTSYGEIFRDLYTLKVGESITIFSNDVAYTYAVSETLILPEMGQPLEVRQANAHYTLPTEDERLTLVTCHPYGSLQYRLIVIARRIKPHHER